MGNRFTIEQREKLQKSILSLTDFELSEIQNLVKQFSKPMYFDYNHDSPWFNDEFCSAFGDVLRMHHTASKGPFTKDKFEFAMEKIFRLLGLQADLAKVDNPGEDITIDGIKCSLKTEAEKSLKRDTIHISKYMELGKGKWEVESDLIGLREQFFEHLTHYERIFTLRCLQRGPQLWEYELVEIPKALFEESAHYPIHMVKNSKQRDHKPAYCYVPEKGPDMKYALYFDGGGERKLQIKYLKKSLCTVQATWRFLTEINQD